MSEPTELSNDIAALGPTADASPDCPFAAGASLEELASVLIGLGLRGLDTAAGLIRVLSTHRTGSTRLDSRLDLLSGACDEDSAVKELSRNELASLGSLLSRYAEDVSACEQNSEFADAYRSLAPLLPPLTATSVIMHAHKKEGTRSQYYECPSLWAVLLMLEDQGEKATGLPPRELLVSFAQFCARSRCTIAHTVIATFRFLLTYAEIPGIQIVLLSDPTKRTNRAVDIMNKKCALMHSYILHTIDASQLKSASKNADGPMPDTLEEYVKVLIVQLRGRYKQLFSITILKGQKPLRPARPVNKDNRGGARFHKKTPKHDGRQEAPDPQP